MTLKDDSKIELFLSLIAYSNGTWNCDDVIKAYEYLKKEITTESTPMKLVKIEKPQVPTTH